MEDGFPAATLPSGHLCTSATLVDLWLLGRLKHIRPNRPGTFAAATDQQRTATSAELEHPKVPCSHPRVLRSPNVRWLRWKQSYLHSKRARLRCSATDTKARSLEQLIGIKEAELYAPGDLLRPQSVAWSKYALMRPTNGCSDWPRSSCCMTSAGRLSESFEALTKDAHVPRYRCTLKSTQYDNKFAGTPCSKDRARTTGWGCTRPPKPAPCALPRPPLFKNILFILIFSTLDYPEARC